MRAIMTFSGFKKNFFLNNRLYNRLGSNSIQLHKYFLYHNHLPAHRVRTYRHINVRMALYPLAHVNIRNWLEQNGPRRWWWCDGIVYLFAVLCCHTPLCVRDGWSGGWLLLRCLKIIGVKSEGIKKKNWLTVRSTDSFILYSRGRGALNIRLNVRNVDFFFSWFFFFFQYSFEFKRK